MPIAVSGFEHLAGEMLAVYEQAETTMLHKMAGHLGSDMSSDRWASRKYAEVSSVRKELQSVVGDLRSGRRSMSEGFVNTAWDASTGAFVAEASKFTEILGVPVLARNAPKVAAILSELDTKFDAADRVILRRCDDAYADIIGRVSAKVATGSITYRQAVKEELDAFADRGIAGFVDKNGHAWDMATYAEMATLTAIERATLEGYIDTMQSYGYDLAIISSHAGACPLCVAWEDVIVSVSGDNPDYPSLGDAEASGCFHPRCLHHISTYYEGITEGGRNRPREVEEPSSAYSSRQQQRMYERKIRQWKRRMAVATDPQSEREAYARVRMYQQKIRALISDYKGQNDSLPRKYWREGGRQYLSPDAKRLKPIKLAM